MHDDAHTRDDDARDAIMDEAYRMGRDHGRDAAGWYFDGNTSIDTYAATLAGIREGDPAIYDTFPASPLSGEWADDPTPATVLAALGLSDDDDDADDALAMYEDGFGVAVADVIESACIAALDPGAAAHIGPERTYRVEGYGAVAWRVERAAGGLVYAHMIGDDRTFTLDPDDMTPIGDDDYCAECGQIGCTHDGRERGNG